MNLLFYSDLHIRPETHHTCEIVLERVGELAKKHRALIVNGGDTHNTRGIIKTSSLDVLTRHYRRWYEDGLLQNILVGNHDQEDREGEVHPMGAFEKWVGWNVIHQPKIIDGIAYLPYMSHERCKEAIKFALKNGATTAVVHWGIQGAKRNDWNTDTDGVPVEWLKKFKRVFSGHYHYRNQFGNVQYIGSPYQQSHAEANQQKGVIIYDNKKDKVQFVEIEGTPKYHTVNWRFKEEGEDADIQGPLGDIGKDDHVKVEVEGDQEQVNTVTHEEVRKHFVCDNVKFSRLGRVKAHSRLGLTASEHLDPAALMQKYTDFVDTSLDRKRLMEVGKGLL